MAEVRLVDIGKTYESAKTATIENLDLEIRDGEFMVLVGPSGCGKSTTLRMIAGLEDATSGDIFIGDRRMNDVPPKDRDIAMVFQNYALYPHMTVRENLAFGLKLRRYSREEIARRVSETAESLEITDYLDRKPKALSGGQRQRVALGRAIVRKPNVFLFDEPLSNLDAKLRVQMRTEIKKLHMALGTTMIYVTHDQVEAMTMGDRITVMKSGVIHQVDTPLNLYNTPADLFVAGFIGNPSMNLIRVRLSSSPPFNAFMEGLSVAVPGPQTSSLEKYRDGELILGIRPEHIHLEPGECKQPAAVRVRHDVSELLGNEVYLYCSAASRPVVARVPSGIKPAMGEEITLYFDMQFAHWFDTSGELRIVIQE
jgi:multiple sugar transport system ATP-binding protein